MAHVFSNIRKFCSKLDEFRNIGRYTDVIIKCEDRIFKCHKLALAATCEYFDSMLGGHFKEKKSEIITLKEIGAATFEQVLKFIYSGDTVVNADNVSGLLHACEFFNLPDLQDLCIQFLEINKFTFQNVFDVFNFACATKKNKIIDMSALFIVRWFEILSNDERFCEIPFDNLEIILIKFSSLTRKNENSLLNAITKWIQYSRDLRLQYCNVLIGMINFGTILPSYVELMYKKLLASTDANFLRHDVESLGTENQQIFEKQKQTVSKHATNKYLHLLIKHLGNNSRKVLSIKDTRSLCSLRGEIPPSSDEWIRCVAVDDFYIYGLHFNGYSNRNINKCKHKFCVYSSIDMLSERDLKPPPVNLYGMGTEVCAIKNNIYVYHPYTLIISEDLSMINETYYELTKEEICRGIYSYNFETDRWFSVPEMKRKLDMSCMTVCDDTLYVVGGGADKFSSESYYVSGYAQAYDCREGTWRELPSSNSKFSAAACCAIDGKVYVCGGNSSSRIQLERYDIAAGRWENLAPMKTPMCYHRAVSYMNLLWVMGSFDMSHSMKVIENLSIQVYDLNTNEWNIYKASTEENPQSGCIMDAIVYKSPY